MTARVTAAAIAAASITPVGLTLAAEQDDSRAFDGMGDYFGGSALQSKWTAYQGDGTATIAVSGSELNLTCNAGGSGDSFWFDAEQGILVYQLVVGDFDAIATIRVRNSADDGLPTVNDGNYRIAGLAAHDPDRSTVLNYVHIGLGCTASAAITCETKNTVDSVSDFDAAAAATGAGQVRILREGQTFSMYYRASASASWTLENTYDRTGFEMPDTLQLGFVVYASIAGHDIRIFVDDFTVTRP